MPHGTPQTTGADQAFLHPPSFKLIITGANHGFLPPSLDSRVRIRLFCPRRVHLRPVCARNPFTQHVIFSKSTCLHSRKPQNRHYSALGPLCLKTNPENKITCWRIRRFRGGAPDRRRGPGRSGASCQSAC